MKHKLIFLFLLLSTFWAGAQVEMTDSDLQLEADTIKAVIGGAHANNASRIGRMVKNIIASKQHKFTLTTVGTGGAATFTDDILNIPNYNTPLPSNSAGVLKNDGSGSLSWATDISSLNGSWTGVTLINGWQNYVGEQFQYRINSTGLVQFRGRIDATFSSSTTATNTSAVPIPYGSSNSAVSAWIPVVDRSDGSIGFIKILSTGQIEMSSNSGVSNFDLNGVSYQTSL